MDYKKRALDLLNEGITDRHEITEKLKQEGYTNTYGEELNYHTVKRALAPSRCEGIKEGQEERTPKIDTFDNYYLVTSGIKTIKVEKSKLRKIKELYCDDTPLNINSICRELHIPKSDFILIKTAFNITHNDVPYLDEDILNNDLDELVNETIQRRKEQYFIKLQETEIKELRKEVNEYREQEYFINRIHDLVSEYQFEKIDIAPLKPRKSNLMLEFSTVDLHFGKMAWSPESGESYDYKIATERFMNVVDDVIDRTKDKDIEKILYVTGSDFYNYDTIDGKTTLGTQQCNDLRWQKMFVKGLELQAMAIDRLSMKAPVEVKNILGNHDEQTSFYAIMYLAAYFKDNPNVTVDTSPLARKYVEWGKCLIGFTHGDKEKKRIFGNMQVEAPEAWGRTKYREWHCGHLHSEQVKEEHGIKVRNLSSITGTDAWHYKSGYVGAIATNQSFIWDKERGLQEIIFSTIER